MQIQGSLQYAGPRGGTYVLAMVDGERKLLMQGEHCSSGALHLHSNVYITYVGGAAS